MSQWMMVMATLVVFACPSAMACGSWSLRAPDGKVRFKQGYETIYNQAGKPVIKFNYGEDRGKPPSDVENAEVSIVSTGQTWKLAWPSMRLKNGPSLVFSENSISVGKKRYGLKIVELKEKARRPRAVPSNVRQFHVEVRDGERVVLASDHAWDVCEIDQKPVKAIRRRISQRVALSLLAMNQEK